MVSFGWWACRSGRSSNTCGTITDAAREVEETGAVEEATCIIATWAAEVAACCNVAPWACRRGQKWKWAKVAPCSYTRRRLTNPLSMLLFPASKYLPPLHQEQSTIKILLINKVDLMHSFIANAIYVHKTGTLGAIDVCSLVITPLYLRYQGATNCQVIASVGQWVLRAEMLSSVRPSHRNRHNSLANHVSKDPPSSLQNTLSSIQTKPLYISTEGLATHFWDWAKPNILYSTGMNYWSTYGEDQGILVAMDE